MKLKTILFIGAVCSLSFMSSCKKDWSCQCTTSGSSGNGVTTSHEIDDETLLNARAKCKSYEGSVGGVSTSCSLQ